MDKHVPETEMSTVCILPPFNRKEKEGGGSVKANKSKEKENSRPPTKLM